MDLPLLCTRWIYLCFLIAGSVRDTLAQQPCIISTNHIVDCHGQNHVKVPDNLPATLEWLDLSYNKLQEINSKDFSAYTKLRGLNLSYNNISKIDDDSFASNTFLKQLSLFNNTLQEMPSSLLEPLKYLEFLDISNNFYKSSTLGGVFGRLTSLKDLSMGGPLISSVLKDDFVPIQNTSLQRFALKTKSSLDRYEPGAFSDLNTNVLWFDVALDTNFIALPLILRDLAGKSFATLRFRNLFETTYYRDTVDLFSGLVDINVKELIFYRGKFNENLLRITLKNVQKSCIQYLSLLSIDFARSPDNIMDEGIQNLKLANLVLKDITNPDILRFDWTFTWFNDIINLYIINVNFNFVPCDAWMQMSNVVALNVSNNRLLSSYLYNPLCHHGLPKVKTFNASTNLLDSLATLSLLTALWPELTSIDLRNNLIGKYNESCTWVPNITSLVLRNNILTVTVFQCLPMTLQYLDMSNSHLDRLNITYFNHAKHLSRLILSNNKIKFIPSGWKSPNLKILALEGNSFGVIDKGSFQDLPQLHTLYAGNNPYHCTCDLHGFITDTLQDGQLKLADWPGEYYCYHPQNLLDTKVELYTPGRLECDVSLVVAIAVSSTAVIVIICMLLCWKFDVPWYLRASCYILRSKYRSRNAEDNKLYAYHAFISYSCSDADWVRQELLDRLESCSPPYKVCIHERDFLPGRWIIDNIIENIENSRKVIFVLSHSFINSEWCNYELYFAHQRAIGHAFEDVILVVKDDLRMEDLPKRYCKLKKLLSTKTYLEWPSEQNRQPFFWVQLKSILGKASSGLAEQNCFSVMNETAVSEQESTSDYPPPTITRNTVNLPGR